MAGPRTEPASARRLAEAHKAGVRPISRDAIALLAVGAAWLVLSARLPTLWTAWKQSLSTAISESARATPAASTTTVLFQDVKAILTTSLPVLVAIVLASLLGWALQGALTFRSRSAAARVSVQSTVGLGTAWSCVKAVVIAAALASLAHHGLRAVVSTPTSDLAYTQRVLRALAELVMSRVGTVLALMAIADLIVQRLLWRRSLRMTRDELKRELRETEGDPTLRAERRGRQRQTALEP